MKTPARAAALALTLASAPALAQQSEFILDDAAPGGADAWVQTGAPEPGTDAAFIADVRVLLASQEPKKARAELDPWIEANERSGNPYLAEAYLLRAEALLGIDREYKALFDLESVIRDFPESEHFARAVEHEFEIGKLYLNGLKRRLLGVRIEPARGVGEELLIRVQERMPGSRLAEDAAMFLADHYYDRRELPLAGDMYAIFLENYPRSEQREKAMLRRIDCAVAQFKGPAYDGSSLIEAKLLLEDYESSYPVAAERAGFSEGLENWIDESGAQQMLETARWYMSTGDDPAARLTLRRLVRRHPESAAAQDAIRVMTERGWMQRDRALKSAKKQAPDDGADANPDTNLDTTPDTDATPVASADQGGDA